LRRWGKNGVGLVYVCGRGMGSDHRSLQESGWGKRGADREEKKRGIKEIGVSRGND